MGLPGSGIVAAPRPDPDEGGRTREKEELKDKQLNRPESHHRKANECRPVNPCQSSCNSPETCQQADLQLWQSVERPGNPGSSSPVGTRRPRRRAWLDDDHQCVVACRVPTGCNNPATAYLSDSSRALLTRGSPPARRRRTPPLLLESLVLD